MKRVVLLLIFLLLPGFAHGGLPGFMLKKMGTMRGQVYVDGNPLPHAMVAFFQESKGLPPVPGARLRIPEFLSRLDSEGRFAVKLPSGRYYIGILIRDPADGPGPPRPGEKYFFAVDDKGELRLHEIADLQELDMGRINGALPEKFAGLAAGETADFFKVEGTVLDKNDAPFSGAIVFAKRIMNEPRPEYISDRTGEDGRFTLDLPTGNDFYLIARQTIAGARPLPGQFMGTYGIVSETGLASPSIFGAGSPPPGVLDENKNAGDRAQTVTASQGEVVGDIRIHMYAIPDPQAIKASLQGTPGSPKFETGANLENIFFPSGSSRLDQKSYSELERWAVFLGGMQGINVEISGHTDSSGPAELNMALSRNRAQAVTDYLISRGIAPNRISVKGYGEEQPVSDNDTEAGKGMNRRVEIRFQ